MASHSDGLKTDSKQEHSPSSASLEKSHESDPQPKPAVTSRSSKSKLWDYLPKWVSTNLRSPRSRKLLFRCWLASWAAFILIVPTGSSVALGATGFFALLASTFLPPNLPVQLFIIIITTMLVGILLGWGIGAAAMRAAVATRDMAHVQSQIQQIQAGAQANGINPQLAITAAIFSGTFLTTNSSVVFGCFLAFGAFIFALMRAYAPKLLMMSIFGTIALDIFCSIGTLFPTPRYTLLNSMLISVSSYAAIALVVTLFIFPETMNHSVLQGVCGILEGAGGLLEMQDRVLEGDVVSEELLEEIKNKRAGVFAALQQLLATSGLIDLEFSWGRWNGDDIRSLNDPLLGIVTRVASVWSSAKLLGERPLGPACDLVASNTPDEKTKGSSSSSGNQPASAATTPITMNDSYLLRQIHTRNTAIESAHNLRIQDILPILKDGTANLRRSVAEGLVSVKAAIQFVTGSRWRWRVKKGAEDEEERVIKNLGESISKLDAALTEFKTTKLLTLSQPYLPLITSATTPREQEALPLRTLYVSYVYSANLIVLSSMMVGFMELVKSTMEKRKGNRLWAPKGLRKVGKMFLVGRRDSRDAVFGDDVEPVRETMDDEEGYRRDPDSRPPENVIQRIMHTIHLGWLWVKTPEGLFTVKYVVVSVALWLPAVFKNSARFYYVERGVWALIMAQTTINIYAADQIFNLVTRILGTFIGLIAGLLAWYMGNAKSTGSSYGSAAAVAAVLVPIVFVRMFAPLHYTAGVVLGCATFALVVGYSWVDGHIAQYASPGVGWPVAWKRFTLVIIGSAASFVIMMLPPRSGRKAVRLRIASTVIGLSKIYSFLMSTWISMELHEKDHPDAPATWIQQFRQKLVDIVGQLQTVQELTALAKWEGSVRGHWPHDEYVRLGEVQMEMLSSLGQLGGALSHLDDNWRLAFLHNTKALNPNFISDVMSIFALVSQSLRTGEPMHQVLPLPLLERLFYHHERSETLSLPHRRDKDILDIEEIQSLEYVYYATGQVAIYQLLKGLDELHEITKRLCGDVPLKGFDHWKDEYTRIHMKV